MVPMILIVTFIGVISNLILYIFLKSRKVISHGTKSILETNGKFTKVLEPGQYFINPLFQKTKEVNWSRTEEYKNNKGGVSTRKKTFKTSIIPINEQTHDLCEIKVITKDNIKIGVNGVLFFKIVDVKKAVYGVDNLYQAMETVVDTSVREQTLYLTIDQVYLNRSEYTSKILENLGAHENDWGVKITYFDIQQIAIPEEISNVTLKNIAIDMSSKAKMKSSEIESRLSIQKLEDKTEVELLTEAMMTKKLESKKQNESRIKEIENEHEMKQNELLFQKKVQKKNFENQYDIKQEENNMLTQLKKEEAEMKILERKKETESFLKQIDHKKKLEEQERYMILQKRKLESDLELEKIKLENEKQTALIGQENQKDIILQQEIMKKEIKEIERQKEIQQKEYLLKIQEIDNNIEKSRKEHDEKMKLIKIHTENEKQKTKKQQKIDFLKDLLEIEGIDQNYLIEIERTKTIKYLSKGQNPIYLSNNKHLLNPFNNMFYDKVVNNE